MNQKPDAKTPCADGAIVWIGPIEPQSYRLILDRTGLGGFASQNDAQFFEVMRSKLLLSTAGQPSFLMRFTSTFSRSK